MKIYHYEGKSNIVGMKIRESRLNQKLSQEELAIKMQLRNIEFSQKVISRIEQQERFVADYELLAFSEVLNLDLYEMFSITKRPDSKEQGIWNESRTKRGGKI